MNKPFAITPVHDLLLCGSADMPIGLYHLHLATAEQLTRLHYKAGMLKTVSKRLKVLVDNGYVQADAKPTKKGNGGYYYALTQKGTHYLDLCGFDVSEALRPDKEMDRHLFFLEHTLDLNDIYIAALQLKHVSGSCYLHRRISERSFKREPLKFQYGNENLRLIPDGFLDFRIRAQDGPERYVGLVLEHDRGTEQQEHFKRRIKLYKAFLGSGTAKQALGLPAVIVAFTTFTGAKRAAKMREWTFQELQGNPQLLPLFIFAELPKPLEPKHLLFERRWYTLTDGQPIALLEG